MPSHGVTQSYGSFVQGLSSDSYKERESYENVAVLIPCYNEAATIGKVIDDFRAVLPGAAIRVSDNNSTDATSAIASAHGANVS